jgi:hypothetical protein
VPGSKLVGRLGRVRSFAAIALCLPVLAGCGADGESYVADNEALLERLPAFPQAAAGRVTSSPYKRWEDAFWQPVAPVRGFTTYRSSEMVRRVRPREVIDFYRRELGDDWIEVDASPRSLSLRNGDAYLHVLAGEDRLALWVDHDYCKTGWSRPGC